jgi:hypothetical protein
LPPTNTRYVTIFSYTPLENENRELGIGDKLGEKALAFLCMAYADMKILSPFMVNNTQ